VALVGKPLPAGVGPAPGDERRAPSPGPQVASRPFRPAPGRAQASLAGWAFPAAIAGGCGALALLVYVRTLAPTVSAEGDSGELVVVAKLLGVAHPPGYPLFTMLGHLFTLLPFGSVAYRVNLMSAVCDALAVSIVAWCTYRLLAPAAPGETWPRGSRWPAVCAAAVGALTLAFSSAFWAYSVVAEVFALNNLLAALILLLLLEWERRPDRAGFLWSAGLVSGLGMAHQQTLAFCAPACLLLLASGMRRLVKTHSGAGPRVEVARQIGVTLVFFLVGLLPYIYLPLAASRDPALNWGDPRTLQAFVGDVTRAEYGTFRFSAGSGSGSAGDILGMFFGSLYDGYTLLGCVLVLLGAWWLWRRRRVQIIALALAFVLTGPVFVSFTSAPSSLPGLAIALLQRFWILPALFLAPVAGAGSLQLFAWLRPSAQSRPWLLPVLGALLLAVPLGSMLVHYRAADHSQDRLASYIGEDMLAPMDQGALFLMQGDWSTDVADYVQLVEGYRRDVLTVSMGKLTLPSYVHQMVRQHPGIIPSLSYQSADDFTRLVATNLSSRAVYVIGDPEGVAFSAPFEIEPAGVVSKLVPKGSDPDPNTLLQSKIGLLEAAHYPAALARETTNDWAIDQWYGELAFEVGDGLALGNQDAQAAGFYRRAITLRPANALAYRNLGSVLSKEGAPASEIAPLWEQYLRADPGDTEAAAIAQQLRELSPPH